MSTIDPTTGNITYTLEEVIVIMNETYEAGKEQGEANGWKLAGLLAVAVGAGALVGIIANVVSGTNTVEPVKLIKHTPRVRSKLSNETLAAFNPS
jgi:hypothetical protein